MAITRATNIAGLGTVFDALTDGGGLEITAGVSTFSDLNATRVNVTGVVTASSFVGDGSSLTGVGNTNNIRTNFLSVSGVSTFQSHVHLGDSDQLRFGASDDLALFHNGNDSFVYEKGTGNLALVSTLGDITFSTDNSGSTLETLRIKGSSGFVGIGTTNPGQELEIHKNARSGSTNADIRLKGADDISVYMDVFHGNSTQGIMCTSSTTPFTLGVGTTEWVRVTAGGGIGIHTTTLDSDAYIYSFGKIVHINRNSVGNVNDSRGRSLGLTVSSTPSLISGAGVYDPTAGSGSMFSGGSGIDPTDNGRNTSFIGWGSSDPIVLTFRNMALEDYNCFYDFIADANSRKFYIQGGATASKGPMVTLGEGINNRGVGIGTTDISGGQLTVASFESSVKQVALKDLANNWVRKIAVNSNGSLGIYDGDTEEISITRDGKIGIFETAPGAFLEIENTDASIAVHYSGHSRGGIAGLSTQRVAVYTTAAADDIVFGRATATTITSDNFVEHMRLDNGTKQLLKPYQSAFNAKGTNDSMASGSGEVVKFDSELFDVNGDFDPSTYKFTAPHDGTYLFFVHAIQTNTDADRSCEMWLRINGTGARHFLDRKVKVGSGSNTFSQQGTQILVLSDGDTVHVEITGDAYNLETNSHFGGYFLG